MMNSLKCVKQLEEAGVSREQAEAHIHVLTELMQTNFATQQNLKDQTLVLSQDMKNLAAELRQEMADLKTGLRQEMRDLATELRGEIQLLRQDLEHKIIQSEQRMVIKLGTIVSVAIGVAVTLSKLVS